MCSSRFSVFSFLWIPLPSNLMHFLCREPLNLKTGEREISFSQKHRGNNKHNICNHLSGEMVIYLSKNVLTFFAIGGEGKGTHSPESKYVAIRITASANSLLQMELPTTLSLMFWGKASSVFVCKEGKASFPRSKPGTITITVSSTTFVETKLPANLCDHSWSFFLAKGTQRSIMLYNDVLQNSALYEN